MYRVGLSNDIHPLKKKESFIYLGGVKIISNYEIISHSDGDIILHALAESIYGALGLGDIGDHFSDQDEKNKNISSQIILFDALKKMNALKYKICNADISLICEKIIIKNDKENISKSIKKLTDCNYINVKATRWEEDKDMIQCNCVILLESIISK
ncbi:MAG: 2-C-methyl-D-erythritol 2,4-cyclodiphosphate synthase [Mycoplasmoidaceae bacterium]